ncbi:helix-turn-helix transcriptional regulator [bacterium]|nr:helix-turn-helix transcriptional regulator [bacterium]
MINLVKFGHNLKVERVKLDYTQEQLALIIGIQQSHLAKIERGETDIRISTLVALLKALNVPFEKLYDVNET